MSCTMCRRSLEGLKEVKIEAKDPLDFQTINVFGEADKIYQCPWCDEYWREERRLSVELVPAGEKSEDIAVSPDGSVIQNVRVGIAKKQIPLGYDITKIKV